MYPVPDDQARSQSTQRAASPYVFECTFCGKAFGSDVVGLALHIGRTHDHTRTRRQQAPG